MGSNRPSEKDKKLNHLNKVPEKLVPNVSPQVALVEYKFLCEKLVDLKMKNEITEYAIFYAIKDLCAHFGYYPDEIIAMDMYSKNNYPMSGSSF